MHGREGEKRLHRRHMWPVPSPTTSPVAASKSAAITPDSFSKDGRKIRVGDCALFKPPQDSPPFVGIIRRLIIGKDDSLSLCVNWLYRPADVKVGKAILLEAAPNEVFYSFHKDEIPAASLLHPCKVAFLRKGVELPSGISSFVCRRVYDIENKRLWWLTDQDYINKRQEEVDQLLDKTRLEMYGAVQSGGRSPKSLNGPTGTQQLKPNSDSVPNTSSSYPSQIKGKKRELGGQGSDPIKRERSEHMLKSEIAKITDKGGLVDFEGVEKLVQLMQPDGVEKKVDLACRIMLVDVIAVTDRFDCLGRFVQLRGLPVLDEWLQEVHKGKIGDGSSPKESDKSVEEFLLALLRALDKLPVNLLALQTCNVGKSVNHLRTHKNYEIQKKARGLVDTWKKRVEVEMNAIDSKPGSTRGGSWPNKSVISDVSQVGSRRIGGSSEVGVKGSIIQSCASKAPQVKVGFGDTVAKISPSSPGSTKMSFSVTTSGVSSTKDLSSVTLVRGGSSELPLTTIKEEKSSSSSQSQNNSQSCSSDHGKTGASGSREDARSSTAGSMSVNKNSGGVSRNRKSSNGLHGSAISGVQKETCFGKISSLNRNLASEKVSPTRGASERLLDVPFVDNGNSPRLIVKLPNTGRSPSQSASGGSPEDASAMFWKGSPLAHSEKLDNQDRKVKGKSDTLRVSIASNTNMDLCQTKDGLAGVLCEEQSRNGEVGEKHTEASKAIGSSLETTPDPGKSYEASFSSINALIESCAKFSEASASGGDDIGMNLLASVAAGEISRSDASPLYSPGRKSPEPDGSCSGNNVKTDEDRAQSENEPNDGINGAVTAEQGCSVDSVSAKSGSQHDSMPVATNYRGNSVVTLFSCEGKTGKYDAELNSSSTELPQNGNGQFSSSVGKPPEIIQDVSAARSSVDPSKGGNAEGEGADQFHELRKSVASRTRSHNVSNSKQKARSPVSDEDKNVGCSDEKAIENSAVVVQETANTSAKVEVKDNEDSTSCLSSYTRVEDKKMVQKQSGSSNLMEQQESHILCGKSKDAAPATGSCNVSGMDLKAEKADDMKLGSHIEQSEKQKMDLGSCILDHSSESAQENLEKKEVPGHCPGGLAPPKEFPASPVQETENCLKSSGCKSDGVGAEEPASKANFSSASVSGSDTTVMLDFDLNEGLPVEDGSIGELVKFSIPENSSSAHSSFPLPISIASISGSLPASITVAAAAKGPFFPPENPLRSKGELGWKGSAATSAFRPAEPRKVFEMPLSTTNVLVDNSTSKKGRPLLDFDLNIPDQRVLEDASQSYAPITCSETGPRDRSGGGLNLDLNRCDESPEIGQFSVSNRCRFEIPKFAVRSPLSGGFSNAVSNGSRDFDLNNGPGLEEVGSETAHVKSSMPFLSAVPGIRMNNMEPGNFSSWLPPTNSYSPIAIPPMFPGRGEHGYPIVPASGSQRILAPPTSIGSEIYRGAVLSSSPAVPFPPTTPFQYQGFPFETNFSLPSNSYPVSSTAYVDTSSGGPLCFPAIPTGMAASHYPRPPYIMSLPGGTSNFGPESRKWGSQGLDLNAGPGGTADVERREERLPSALRQLSVTGSPAAIDEQLKMYQMGGGVLKRKEPDGGWDGDRISYKHPSWQ